MPSLPSPGQGKSGLAALSPHEGNGLLDTLHTLSFSRELSFFFLMKSSLSSKIHRVQSFSFVDFKREALLSSKIWQQLENKGKEQSLAIIRRVGRAGVEMAETGG